MNVAALLRRARLDAHLSLRALADRAGTSHSTLAAYESCLCLSIGASTAPEALHRVFGSASHANAPTLADLSARMDELFLSALKELAAPNPLAKRKR